MSIVKEHFEAEAKEYDKLILKLIPFYDQMTHALVSAICFDVSSPIRVIDLGCGTGKISKMISEKYPNSKIVCIDIASNMIEIAKYSLRMHSDVKFITGNFKEIDFTGKYDVVVSSLALHHLETDSEKIDFYRKIYNALAENGIFFNADVVLSSTDYLQNISMGKWIEYMLKNTSEEDVTNKWLPTYEKEDRPVSLMNHLKWLKETGFHSIDVLWKYYTFAVYGGMK